jgi:PAS domain S-box-containing protein
MLLVGDAGSVVQGNRQAERLFGYTRQELTAMPISRLIGDGHDGAERHAARTGFGHRKDGSELPIQIICDRLQTAKAAYALVSVVDLTDHRLAERAREELADQRAAALRLEERGRFFELSLDLVGLVRNDGLLLQVNPAFSDKLGHTQRNLVGSSLLDLVHPDDVERTRHELLTTAAARFTNRCRGRDGTYRYLEWRTMPDSDGILYATARDVTQDRELVEALRSRQNSLAASLAERSVLLQEVHHRVKNNLQVVSSLIKMQSERLSDGGRSSRAR